MSSFNVPFTTAISQYAFLMAAFHFFTFYMLLGDSFCRFGGDPTDLSPLTKEIFKGKYHIKCREDIFYRYNFASPPQTLIVQ